MLIEEFVETLNEWGGKEIPFLFLIDFEMQKPLAFRLQDIDAGKILYDINGHTNSPNITPVHTPVNLTKFPLAFKEYKRRFEMVRKHLSYGDSYLTNLTIKTKVRTSVSLNTIFHLSQAKYKLWFEDKFLVFSPETFVRIDQGRIFTYPMKGTIDASLPEAREKILNDEKERAEHITIVDLLRNDLSGVSNNVRVTRFRYVEEIKTNDKNLLQVSSEIQGDLPENYMQRLGDIFMKLLPAGSVSGAPKCKTLEIIRKAEGEPRGYYTGVVGLFDGKAFDSGVMIRFMESDHGTIYYRSGGGITVQSVSENEYQEAIDKVYVPLN